MAGNWGKARGVGGHRRGENGEWEIEEGTSKDRYDVRLDDSNRHSHTKHEVYVDSCTSLAQEFKWDCEYGYPVFSILLNLEYMCV